LSFRSARGDERQKWVNYGPRGHAHRTSVDPPIPDEIAAARKSAVPCISGPEQGQLDAQMEAG